MEFEYKIITHAFGQFSDDQFFAFCQDNCNLRFERTAEGDIIIMPPTGGEMGFINSNIVTELAIWNRKEKQGIVFDSSTGFVLPNGAMRSPDASWVKLERWKALSTNEKKKFPPLCPDFVIELKSETDPLPALQKKMKEWIANGCRLAWLIDVKDEKVYIYCLGKSVETIASFNYPLSGFLLDLTVIK